MNIYLVSQTGRDTSGRDELLKAVIVAPGPQSARAYAAHAHGDEGYDFWFTTAAIVKHIGRACEDMEPGIICADFPPG